MRPRSPEDQRLSSLLDTAFDLDPPAREAWLAALEPDDAPFVPRLRDLLGLQTQTRATRDAIPASAAPPATLAVGDPVGPYRLLRVIGSGGMGDVWLAERADGQLKRALALKLPRLGLRRDVLVQRFARERDILAGLAHPHIAQLLDAGVARDGQPYLALEYVEGEAIDHWCRTRGSSLATRIDLLLQAAQAVAFAHARLVLHRDLKPANLLVDAQGHVKLLDFGIAKLMEDEQAHETQLTHAAGRAYTPDYASPEQIRGEPLSTASDVYSLAVVAFELLTGAKPCPPRRAGVGGVEDAVLEVEASLASSVAGDRALRRLLEGDLDAILQQALQKEPARRYASVDAFADDLQRWRAGQPVRARPVGRVERGRRWALRNKALAGTAAAVVVSVLAGAVLSSWQALRAQQQSERAEAAAARAANESRRARAVQNFLLDIFRVNSVYQQDPQRAQRTTARELLDLGAERAELALKDAPESHIDVLATFGDLYLQLGLTPKATALFKRRLELARSVLPADDPRRASALMSVAGRYYDGPKREQARALLAEARQVLDAAGDADSPVRASLRWQTARFERFESMRAALTNVDAALALYRRGGDETAILRALNLAAALRLVAGDLAGAEATLTEARAMARSHTGGSGAALIMSTAELGDAQHARGRFAEAEASWRELVDTSVRVNGAEHPVSLVFRVQLANFLFETGRSDEARRIQHEVRETIRNGGTRYDSGWAGNTEHLMARTLFDRGRPQAMHEVQLVGIMQLRQELPRSGALAQRERMLAEMEVALGRLDDAASTLTLARDRWLAFMQGELRSGSLNSFHLAAAKLHLARGAAPLALAALDDVRPTAGIEPGAFDIALMRRDSLRAEAWRVSGEFERAEQSARQALARLRDVPAPYRVAYHEATALTVLGRVQQARGDLPGARASLEQAVALRRAQEEPDSVWLADSLAALAACRQLQRPTR